MGSKVINNRTPGNPLTLTPHDNEEVKSSLKHDKKLKEVPT